MTGWDNTDLRALRRIGVGLGAFQVIEVKENSVTEQAPENDMWDGEEDAAPAQNASPQLITGRLGGGSYPEHSYKLADHVYTWSPKLPDGSMLVIRAQSAEELASAAEALGPVAGRLMAAWSNVTGRQGPATPPPFGPNVSVPAAPGYQGPPVQQQAPQQWGAPAPQMPQQQGWGGAPQAQQGGQQQRKQYPAPQGWYKLTVPYPKGTEQLHALAASLGITKGNPDKGGMYNFWGLTPSGQPGKAWYCSPAVVQAFQQYSPVVA